MTKCYQNEFEDGTKTSCLYCKTIPQKVSNCINLIVAEQLTRINEIFSEDKTFVNTINDA